MPIASYNERFAFISTSDRETPLIPLVAHSTTLCIFSTEKSSFSPLALVTCIWVHTFPFKNVFRCRLLYTKYTGKSTGKFQEYQKKTGSQTTPRSAESEKIYFFFSSNLDTNASSLELIPAPAILHSTTLSAISSNLFSTLETRFSTRSKR